MRCFRIVTAVLFMAALMPIQALAGTTGGVTGRVLDAQNQAPIAGATVTATSPSQTASVVTDANGRYSFLTLAPDTYTLSFAKDGYDPVAQPGLGVFADQVQTYIASMRKTIRTIAHVTSQSASNLVKAGQTSDVYSIDAAGQKAASTLVGPGGLSNAYGAIQSAPGVAIDQGEQGWFQTVHIRGGDIDQVGYELDGIPVNRVYDNAPMSMLSSLGSQEVQVYTGGTPASADAQGISGYVNQVLKTGTFPGYATGTLAVGSPTFYHQASIEAGGSTPDRLFSYYIGLGGANQTYRYIDNFQGAGIPYTYFYPVNAGPYGFPYTGGNGGANLWTSGVAWAITATQQRDNLINLHFGIPHASGLRDDLQLLWMTSELWAQYYSSQNDLGYGVVNNCSSPSPSSCSDPQYWDDSLLYKGPLMGTPSSSSVAPYYFPSSPTSRIFNGYNLANNYNCTAPIGPVTKTTCSTIDPNQRDANDNGVAVTKLQYTHAFSSSSYLRLYGYMLYSNWFINGPNTAAQPYFGAELADYEIPDHTGGFNLNYTNQLSSQHLLTATYGYTQSNLQRYYVGYISPNYNVANFVGRNGLCYNPTSGDQQSCYSQAQGDYSNVNGSIYNVYTNTLTQNTMPAGSIGAKEGAQWTITNNNFNAALNPVHTQFAGFSISDQWRPSDALTFNIGARNEDFTYLFGDTTGAARPFWFNAYNSEYCVGPLGSGAPQLGTFTNTKSGQLQVTCPKGYTTVGASGRPLVNTSGGTYTAARFEPRIGATWTLDPTSVIRASFGVYARPPNSSWVQYDTVQQDLPSYLGAHFYNYGFNSPEHLIRPDTSYNYDLSWEHRLKNTDWSFKLTPFFRSTRDQLQNFFIDPQGGLESGLNVGTQQAMGVEFALQKGSFTHDGWAGQLSYTYTHSQIKYQNFPNLNENIIDQLNSYIELYNSYTGACAGVTSSSANWVNCGSGAFGGNASKTLQNANGKPVTNPYFNSRIQALMDRNAWYPTYDIIPSPGSASNGYAVPHVITLIVNYKHQRLDVTPSLIFNSGAEYGSPLQWPGYVPQTCTGKGSNNAATCLGTASNGFPLMLPDPYNNGNFDGLGNFKQPYRISLNLGMQYIVSPRVTASLSLANIVDFCGQRGYQWDSPNTCVYGSLAGGLFYPGGNFYPNANGAVPPQMNHPYGPWLNFANTGFLGTTIPMQVTGQLQFKL